MPEEIVIRSASPAEAAMLLDVMRRSFAEYRGVLRPESSVFVETPDMISTKLAGGGGFLAFQDAAPVGCVIAEAKADRAYLGRLAVDPKLRRQGLARQLMLTAEDFARSRGLAKAEVHVRIALTGNIALFQNLGYREIAQERHPGWPEPTYLVMEKSLK